MIHVTDEALASMLLYSVRYAMGRCSTAPSNVASMMRCYREALTVHQEDRIRAEITEELRRCEESGTTLGDACDHDTWTKLVRDLSE